jgi:hypothetical protein
MLITLTAASQPSHSTGSSYGRRLRGARLATPEQPTTAAATTRPMIVQRKDTDLMIRSRLSWRRTNLCRSSRHFQAVATSDGGYAACHTENLLAGRGTRSRFTRPTIPSTTADERRHEPRASRYRQTGALYTLLTTQRSNSATLFNPPGLTWTNGEIVAGRTSDNVVS